MIPIEPVRRRGIEPPPPVRAVRRVARWPPEDEQDGRRGDERDPDEDERDGRDDDVPHVDVRA